MRARWAAALALAGTLLGPPHAVPRAASEPEPALTAVERERIDRGELVVRTRPVEGFPWPEVTVDARVAASPAEVMAVYADFDGQAAFMPEMAQSRVVHRDGPAAWRVFYEYQVTGPNERQTVTVRIVAVSGGYRATWDLVTARYARRLSGELRAVADGDGTLVHWASRVDPGMLGATLGSPASVERRLRATVEALARHVERLRADRPDELASLVRSFLTAVGGSSRRDHGFLLAALEPPLGRRLLVANLARAPAPRLRGRVAAPPGRRRQERIARSGASPATRSPGSRGPSRWSGS